MTDPTIKQEEYPYRSPATNKIIMLPKSVATTLNKGYALNGSKKRYEKID